MKKRFKLVKNAIAYTLVLSTLATFTGCVKEVDCDIENEHVHLYVNEDSSLSRYIESEKEYIGDLYRTENSLSMTKELEIINSNEFYMVKDNIDYLSNQINNYQPKRESYSYGYIYGSYYGYGYSLNPSNGKFEYRYGYQTGWHNGYGWQDIDLNEYTDDKVRDITYKFKFYKINDDYTVSAKLFDSFDEITEEYKYFRISDLIQKNVSDSYYLETAKTK